MWAIERTRTPARDTLFELTGENMNSKTLVTMSSLFAGSVFVAGCAGADPSYRYDDGRPRYDTGSTAYRYGAVRSYEGYHGSAREALQRPAISPGA